jgi:hypothetical protein
VFQPYLVVGLEGAYAELASLGPDWTNLQAGVSQLRLVPAGEPSSLPPNATYLLSGCAADKYLSGKNSIAVLWILSDSSSGFESEAGFFIHKNLCCNLCSFKLKIGQKFVVEVFLKTAFIV